MKDSIILSLAVNGREKYSEIVKGLENSMNETNWDGDVMIYKEWPEWVTSHKQAPYAFKYQLIDDAYTKGYRKIIWLDSTMRLIKDKNPIELLNSDELGFVAFHNLGHNLAPYINNTAVTNLHLSLVDTIFQTWGGAILFDFTKRFSNSILGKMLSHITAGSFNDDDTQREGFISHRHDQAVLSGILHKRGYKLYPYGVIAAAKDVTDKTYIQYGDH